MNAVTVLFLLSLFNEKLISEAKNVFSNTSPNWDFISILTGTMLGLIFGQDIFSSLGIMPNNNIPVFISFLLTNIATGFIIGRGSNVMYKFINLLDEKKNLTGAE